MDEAMTPERWQEIKLVLGAVLERSPEERASFLKQACGHDPSLRSEIESLLAHNRPGDSVVDSFGEYQPFGVLDQAGQEDPVDESSLETHQRIGPYEVIRELGHGGVGAVYLAARADDQYRQQVAIKLIRRGMDTDFVLRRFRNERQILAALDHPNIARLLDGGSTENHRPYLVMEYIEGVPIDVYCDSHTLNTEERLKLFRQVCSAVHYAHQHLVIHRDIKPGNILVTEEGRPKLLDFGIAKLLTPELAAQTLDHTGPYLRLMTPAYASPEQIKGQPITTATDVYSLGVLLYELLTGHNPYLVQSQAPLEMMQAVLEKEPTRPSIALSDSGLPISTLRAKGTLTSRMSHDSAISSQLAIRNSKSLRGDLDNIVLMALRKDPQRRYASVQQFSEDIRRHLEGLPVIARGDALSYRASKFIRRNKVGVAAATIILLTLVGGIVAVNQQRKRAERRFNDVRQLAHSVVFDYHDAIADLPGSTPVRQRLVKDALKYLDSLAGEASNDQTLQRELATAYRKIGDVQGNSNMANLGDTAGALISYRKSLAIRQALVAAAPKDSERQSEVAESYERIGDILRTIGDLKQADQNYEQAIRLLGSMPGSAGHDRAQQQRLAELFYRVGNLKGYRRTANLGDISGAVEYYQKALAILEPLSAAAPSDIDLRIDLQECNRSLANLLGSQNDLRGAEPHARKAVATAQDLVKRDLNSARSLRALTEATDSLARLLMRQGELEEAAEVCRQSIDSAQAAVDADPKNMQARQDLASGHALAGALYVKKKDAKTALQHLRQALVLNQAIAADDPGNDSASRWVAQDLVGVGTALTLAGDLTGALRSQKQGLAILEALYEKKPDDGAATNFLSTAYDRFGKTLNAHGERAAALESFRRSLTLGERVLGQHPDNQTLRQQLALTNFNVGEIYLSIAERAAKTPALRQTEYLSEARKSFQSSLDLLLELRRHGALSSEDGTLPEQLTKKIAACDAVLARQPR